MSFLKWIVHQISVKNSVVVALVGFVLQWRRGNQLRKQEVNLQTLQLRLEVYERFVQLIDKSSANFGEYWAKLKFKTEPSKKYTDDQSVFRADQ